MNAYTSINLDLTLEVLRLSALICVSGDGDMCS